MNNNRWITTFAITLSAPLVTTASPALADVTAGDNPGADNRPQMMVEVGAGTELGDEINAICEQPSLQLSVACHSSGEMTDLSETTRDQPFRYRMAIDEAGDDTVSIRVDAPGQGMPVRLIDRRIQFDDDAEFDLVDDTLRRNLIDGGLTSTTQTYPSSTDLWRNTAWQTASLIGGTIWYLTYDELNSLDWDYAGLFADDPNLRPQSDVWRNFGGWRFDDNMMFVNTPLHTLAGSGYYLLARGSHLGMVESALVANLSSLVWEAGIEHQEVISLNDLIFTGIGGIALGEFYHQMGRFFRSAEPTPFNRTMSWIFAVPMELHDLMDGTGPLYAGDRDEMGWPTGTWQRFVLSPRVSLSAADGTDASRIDVGISAGAELIRRPDYLQPEDHSDWIAGPLYSQLSTNIDAGDSVYNWGLDGALDFFGLYRQQIQGDDTGRAGASHFAGIGLGARHYQHRFGDVVDRYGIVHLPGLVTDSTWLTGPADIRLRMAAHPDFYGIDGRAYPAFEDDTNRASGRTVLADERYYYGWGYSAMARLEVDMAPVHLHYTWDHHRSHSIDQLDRFWDDQDRFGEDLDQYLQLTDTVTNHELGLMVHTPFDRIRAGLVGQYRDRSGTVDDNGNQWRSELSDLRTMGVVQMTY